MEAEIEMVEVDGEGWWRARAGSGLMTIEAFGRSPERALAFFYQKVAGHLLDGRLGLPLAEPMVPEDYDA